MHWMILPLKRYADFKGRSPRVEYWMFVLFLAVFVVPLFVAIDATGGLPDAKVPHPAPMTPLRWTLLALLVLYCALTAIPMLAVQVRRLHDQDRSAWGLMYGLVPYFGWAFFLAQMCHAGTFGPNRYGDDPREFPFGDPYSGADRWALPPRPDILPPRPPLG